MCFGVSFHKQRIVPLTPAFKDSVHQLQRNSCPMEAVCLSVMIGDFKHEGGCGCKSPVFISDSVDKKSKWPKI